MPTAECPLCKVKSEECKTREEALERIPHNDGCTSNLADPNYLTAVKYSGKFKPEVDLEVQEPEKPSKKKGKQ